MATRSRYGSPHPRPVAVKTSPCSRSEALAKGRPASVIQQAFQDVSAGLQDTDRSKEIDQTCQMQKPVVPGNESP